MFGLNFTTIFIILALAGAGVGYFKYTQDEMARLNQQIATKDFALKESEATIAKQKEDMAKQAIALDAANKAYNDARNDVADMTEKFNKAGRDFGNWLEAAPTKAQEHINAASKKSWRCIEDVVNKEQHNGNC
jgi:chromosome segregation ATPase